MSVGQQLTEVRIAVAIPRPRRHNDHYPVLRHNSQETFEEIDRRGTRPVQIVDDEQDRFE